MVWSSKIRHGYMKSLNETVAATDGHKHVCAQDRKTMLLRLNSECTQIHSKNN